MVSSAFHFIARPCPRTPSCPSFPCPPIVIPLPHDNKACRVRHDPSGFTPQDVSNADQCATYMVLEQLNMLGSLICTFILFAILMYGGYVYHPQKGRAGPLFHRLCKDTIGNFKMRIPGEWWNIVSNTKTWWALFMYVVVFAGLGHGTAVVYVHAKQKKRCYTAVYRSYVMTNMKRGGTLRRPPRRSSSRVHEYAMYNDLFNNFIMIILLVFPVNYVKEKFATTAATKAGCIFGCGFTGCIFGCGCGPKASVWMRVPSLVRLWVRLRIWLPCEINSNGINKFGKLDAVGAHVGVPARSAACFSR